MKIAVMGTGGVGGYFGGLLARAGEDVTFIARCAHLDAIRKNGLKVVSDLSGEFVAGSSATDDPKSLGPVDLVLYTVKMYSNDQAIPFISPLVGPESVVLTLQNGIDNADRLAAAYGKERVMIGMVILQGRIREPGVVEQLGQVGRAVFGETGQAASTGSFDSLRTESGQGITPRGERLLKVFEKGGWNVELSANALGALWQKFTYLAGTAGVNAVTQIPYGEMRAIPETRELIRQSCQEVVNIARAARAPVDENIMDWVMTQLDNFPAEGMASLAKDFRDGSRVEIEGLTGTVVRMGKELGVHTPVNSAIYALLKPAALRIEKSI